MELPFASLHQLCAPLLRELRDLPAPQRDAMSVAFGLREGKAPDRFLLGLAALGLVANAAKAQPLACLVDDAQWLDEGSLQVLGFVARRLMVESTAMVFAVREPCADRALAGLPEMIVHGLSEPDARALLASAVRVPLDPLVRDRIIAEAHGNPMALLHLPRAPAELAGGFWLPDRRPLDRRLEDSFPQRCGSLPPDSARLVLTAAAEPTGDVSLVWRAAALQGIPPDAAAPAEATGLVEFGRRRSPRRHTAQEAQAPRCS